MPMPSEKSDKTTNVSSPKIIFDVYMFLLGWNELVITLFWQKSGYHMTWRGKNECNDCCGNLLACSILVSVTVEICVML
jgi:hypothetical protein